MLQPKIEELRRQGGFQISDGAGARIAAKRRELAPLCEAGNLELCENLGDIEWDRRHPAGTILRQALVSGTPAMKVRARKLVSAFSRGPHE